MELGVKVALTPEGRPLTDKATVCALPEVTAVETVRPVLVPACADTVVGSAEIPKSSATAPQPASLKAPMRVRQLNEPLAERYWLTYQNVQSSVGSMPIIV